MISIGLPRLHVAGRRRVNSAIVTPELLNVIGVSPMRGRVFTTADSVPGAAAVAVISYPGLSDAGLKDHLLWGTMLLVIIFYGPGKIAIDEWLRRRYAT